MLGNSCQKGPFLSPNQDTPRSVFSIEVMKNDDVWTLDFVIATARLDLVIDHFLPLARSEFILHTNANGQSWWKIISCDPSREQGKVDGKHQGLDARDRVREKNDSCFRFGNQNGATPLDDLFVRLS